MVSERNTEIILSLQAIVRVAGYKKKIVVRRINAMNIKITFK